MLSPQPHFLSPKGSSLSPLLLLTLLSTGTFAIPFPGTCSHRPLCYGPTIPSGPQNLAEPRGQGWGASPWDPAALSLQRAPPGAPISQHRAKAQPAPRQKRLLQLLMSAPRSPRSGEHGGAPTARRVPPPEGEKTAENKQTAGVHGAAVIFGLEGVHTLRVVLANSCEWSWRCGERWLRALAGAGPGALVLTGNPAPQLPSHLAGIALLLSPHPSEATSEGSRGVGQRPWEGGSGLCPRGEGTAVWPALGTGCGWDVAGTRQKPCCHRCWHPGAGRGNAGWALHPTTAAPVPTKAAAPLPPLPRPAPAGPSESTTVSASPWASTPQEKGTFVWRCILQESQLSLMPCLGHWGLCTC